MGVINVHTIEYWLDGKMLQREPMIFSRLYAVGQELTIDFQAYQATAVSVENGTQKVTLQKCEVCRSCGGIKREPNPKFGCVCR